MTVTHRAVDIVTIGAGWTASMLAARILPDTSTEMVSLEQGPARWTYPDFAHNHDSLRYSARYAMMMDLRRETYTWRPNPSKPALPMRQFGSFHPGRGLGGSAIHWSAQLWRFLESDFVYRTHHVDRYGVERLPEGSSVQDWGVSYDDLEPYYDAFDYDIGASGTTGNLRGQLLPGGNPFEAPRRRPYPNPALAELAYESLFRETTQGLGYHPFPQPSGILSRAWVDPFGHERSGCLYCGFCTRFGCEVDAKSSPVTTHLPVALDTGRYEVRVGCKVTGITCADNGLATGVTYVDERGEEHFQPADVVVCSAFTLANVRMLLLSRSDAHPDGVGNDRGLVGTNYTYQLFYAPAKGRWDGRRFNFYMGNTSTMSFIYDFNGDNFDHGDLDFIGGAAIYSQPGEREPVTSVADIAADMGVPSWGAGWKEYLRDHWDSTGTVNIQGESLPYRDQFLDLDPVYRDHLGQPLLRLTFDWHDNDRSLYRFVAQRCGEIARAMGAAKVHVSDELKPYDIHDYKSTHPTGGAIMGTDPSSSVTNTFGQVWDTPNVFVTGAALFPQNPGANPTGTVGAVTYRAADAIRDRYLQHRNELLE
jgi:gluconate 2-dehydrogenase alpha chain